MFTRLPNLNPVVFISAAFLLLGLTFTQFVFSRIQEAQVQTAWRAVQSVARNEVVYSNLFLLSRSLEDLKNLGLLRCATIFDPENQTLLIKIGESETCAASSFFLSGGSKSGELRSLNGKIWITEIGSYNGRGFTYALWLSRLSVILIVVMSAFGYRAWVTRLQQRETRAQLELSRLQLKAERMLSEAQTQKEKADLARGLAHDIRSPLSALRILSSHHSAMPDAYKELYTSATDRIMELADSLLDESNRLENKSLLNSYSELIQICEVAVTTKSIEKNRKNIQLKMEGSDRTATDLIHFDKFELSNILSNLLNNAIEATPLHQPIEVRIDNSETQVQIRIVDRGSGIPEDVLYHLHRGLPITTKEGGHGIGLMKARKSLEKILGEFTITSISGQGTTIGIRLRVASKRPPTLSPKEANLS